jgi:hypothetical protein
MAGSWTPYVLQDRAQYYLGWNLIAVSRDGHNWFTITEGKQENKDFKNKIMAKKK